MLNVKALTALLSHNRDGRLCKQWYVMTPNGTLLAHSQPANINGLRKQAAVAAMTWQEHEHQDPRFDGEIREDNGTTGSLHILIIESDTSNTIMRKLQNQVLLVLEGGVPPRRTGFQKSITAESADGTQQTWPHDGDGASIMSNKTGTSAIAANVLKLQRNKVEALAAAIISDFQKVGFEMPVEGCTAVF
ncbi:hypothetical protein CLAFUW4_00020 [Fulvia fulva]|uniref:Uncharacterized protein n=1 Tax=Passalora fulva TaxID=5499 RepID=A0A9Q8L8K3_PASFU|nr:uncharacterized protein CLAFUR5_00019 [Fulvia fulva]KAK4635327.1 hypothetical protein CLAFUR4_00020 [Fulvia fulva]KAK4637920.1 hypothetical protein CLAFUR0_00020 [Fulvia fulva]UJO12790.1 hypothetical protein CLAFUR5_00019 [Fulvia fulva]WPV09577.1 hypothetical protein CLAFUW4_00020 [Fulvia fulva]WPV23503.1 hypothetical protein CLAFUW7_00020 [Fulvia fulva]